MCVFCTTDYVVGDINVGDCISVGIYRRQMLESTVKCLIFPKTLAEYTFIILLINPSRFII